MKTQFKDLCKGIVVGIANVIPGLSGGTIAVVLNIYDKLINSLKNLFTNPIKVFKEIWGLILGIIIGITFSVFVIIELVTRFPIPTTMLFVGLIIGAIPRIYQNIKTEKKTIIDLFVFILFILFLVILPLLPGHELDVTVNIGTIIILFLIGIISAGSMVIPGVSGSMILMVLGYYIYIWATFGNLISSIINLSFVSMWNSIIPLIPFGLGVIIGIVFISKLISKLLIKHSRTVYCAILGLLIASPFAIIHSMIAEYSEQMQKNIIINLILGVITLILGSVVSLYMSNLHKDEQ